MEVWHDALTPGQRKTLLRTLLLNMSRVGCGSYCAAGAKLDVKDLITLNELSRTCHLYVLCVCAT